MKKKIIMIKIATASYFRPLIQYAFKFHERSNSLMRLQNLFSMSIIHAFIFNEMNFLQGWTQGSDGLQQISAQHVN